MDLGLKNRRALVMGASKGLGRAIAEAIAAEGATVTISGRDAATLAPVVEGLQKASGAKAFAVAADVSDLASIAHLGAEAERLMGGVDILVLNHGGPPAGPASKLDPAVLPQWFQRMVVAPVQLAQQLLPGMRARKWGRIVTVGSSGMVQPLPNMVLSNMLRASIVGWTKTLSAEIAADNVTCNIIAPGMIHTDRIIELTSGAAKQQGIPVKDVIKQREATIPTGRMGNPEEFGAAAAFLVSEKASYVTGSIFRVDGGSVRAI